MDLSHSSASSKLLDQNVLSLASSDPADSALLAASQEEQDVAEESEEACLPHSFWRLWPVPQRD